MESMDGKYRSKKYLLMLHLYKFELLVKPNIMTYVSSKFFFLESFNL